MKLFKLTDEFIANFTEKAIVDYNLRAVQHFGDWYADGFTTKALKEVRQGIVLDDGLLCIDGVWKVITEEQRKDIEDSLNYKG